MWHLAIAIILALIFFSIWRKQIKGVCFPKITCIHCHDKHTLSKVDIFSSRSWLYYRECYYCPVKETYFYRGRIKDPNNPHEPSEQCTALWSEQSCYSPIRESDIIHARWIFLGKRKDLTDEEFYSAKMIYR